MPALCLCCAGMAPYQRGMLLHIIPVKKNAGSYINSQILEIGGEFSSTNSDFSEFNNSLAEKEK